MVDKVAYREHAAGEKVPFDFLQGSLKPRKAARFIPEKIPTYKVSIFQFYKIV